MDRAVPWRPGGRTARVLLACAVGAAVTVPAAACARSSADTRSTALSRAPIAENTGWRKDVLAVPGPYVRPKTVTVEGTGGTATNPNGLLTEGGGTTTLTTTKAGGARLVVDLGVLASGYVELGVKSASGAPIRVSYAEGRQYLGTWGDGDLKPDDFFYHGKTLGTEFFGNRDWPLASAVAVILLIVLVIPIVIFQNQQRKAEGGKA